VRFRSLRADPGESLPSIQDDIMTRLNPARSARLAALAGAASLMILGWGAVPVPARAAGKLQEKTGATVSDARDADRAAIRSTMQSFVQAFASRDAKALAAHWTTQGEYRNEAGETIRGREDLEKGFAKIFAGSPELSADVQPKSLRFLSSDAAVEEGSVTVRRGPAAPPTRAHYNVLLVREAGRWLLAQLSESPEDEAAIADLAWLIGEWRSTTGQGAEIRTRYSWAPSQKFIHAQFTIKEKELALSGFQVIGVDPATGAIHTWTFEADGGVGEADWSRDGADWVLDATGTLADGSTLTETNILRRVDDAAFTWQSIDRKLADAELPDLAPVKVTRIKPEK
jgi:uncharacterized protein (TIGR02246 family)